MRIGIMLQSFDEAMGGIGIYTREVVRALLRTDRVNEYLLIYPGFGAARRHRGQFQQHQNVTEINTADVRGPLVTYGTQITAGVPRTLQKVRALLPVETYWDQVIVPRVAEQYGVDVLFNPHLTVPIRGRFGKVLVLHNVEYHTVPHVYNWRMYIWWFLLEKTILPRADRIISLSHAMTEDLHRYVKYPISQVRTIYHGVSAKFRVEITSDQLAHARKEYQLPAHFLLFVGRLYPQKNFITLARAFALLQDTIPHRLIVAGQPRFKFTEELDFLRELGITDRVDFLRHVPNDDLPMLYHLADCFIYPSFYESFGLAQLEAMACGCPVIGAAAGAIPEITGGAAMLFDPHSPSELAQAILKVTGNPETRRALVERGLARAREFSWERTAQETLAVFRELG